MHGFGMDFFATAPGFIPGTEIGHTYPVMIASPGSGTAPVSRLELDRDIRKSQELLENLEINDE